MPTHADTGFRCTHDFRTKAENALTFVTPMEYPTANTPAEKHPNDRAVPYMSALVACRKGLKGNVATPCLARASAPTASAFICQTTNEGEIDAAAYDIPSNRA